jgi:hypothetical protein
MTRDQKIQTAAEILTRELGRLGDIINERDALRISRQMLDAYERRILPDLAPGEIARRFRERYERHEGCFCANAPVDSATMAQLMRECPGNKDGRCERVLSPAGDYAILKGD